MRTSLYSLFQSSWGQKRKHRLFRLLFSTYPPLVGAGIQVTRISPDLRRIRVEMPLRPWTRNFVGTHFGGSLYAMCDPFYMLLVIEALGRDYVVWDKAASIRFRKPGRGRVSADFELTEAQIASLKKELETKEKIEVTYRAEVKNEQGELVAEVDKLIYVRKKTPTSNHSYLPQDGN